mmetsp:Transcript_29006/g.66647  ORF Transcript_29006/g.66647 Transcript_29006/m.66647 type:complete len:220 (+) Transcript_29006:520-1179(+)
MRCTKASKTVDAMRNTVLGTPCASNSSEPLPKLSLPSELKHEIMATKPVTDSVSLPKTAGMIWAASCSISSPDPCETISTKRSNQKSAFSKVLQPVMSTGGGASVARSEPSEGSKSLSLLPTVCAVTDPSGGKLLGRVRRKREQTPANIVTRTGTQMMALCSIFSILGPAILTASTKIAATTKPMVSMSNFRRILDLGPCTWALLFFTTGMKMMPMMSE